MATSPQPDGESPSVYSAPNLASLLKTKRPAIHLREVVELYMQSKKSGLDGTIHKALNTNDPHVILDPERHKWRPTETAEADLETLYKDIDGDKQDFLKAMESYEANADDKYKLHINMKETHGMKDVLKSIEEARTKYDAKESGLFGRIRKAFRNLGEKENVCNTWLGLLPGDSEYFSIICGGLKMIFGAAGHLRKINDEIIDALIRLPTILNKNRRVIVIHRASTELHNLSSALYVAILHAMSHILSYYKERLMPKAFKVLASQSSFQRTLLMKIAAINQCSDAIDKEAELCGMELTAQIYKETSMTKKIAEGVYEKTGIISEQAGQISKKTDYLTESMEDLRLRTEKAEQRAAIAEQKSKENHEEMCRALNHITVLLMKQPELTSQGAGQDPKTPHSTPQKRTTVMDSKTARKLLLTRLSYDKESPRIDLKSNLRHALSLSAGDQDRAVYVMQSAVLQLWLQETTSSALLINGGAYSSDLRSPLSFVSAKLANSLREARKQSPSNMDPKIVDLHFFCGEHSNWRDGDEDYMPGPASVINSLLAQLLTQYKHFDIASIKHLKSLEWHDVKVMGNILGKLINQLPGKMMVFCIIDGLSYYDDDDMAEDLEKLVKKLISLTRRGSDKNCIFKLLLTVPTRLRLDAVYSLDEEGEVLDVPEVVDRGGGFTDMHWDLGAGQDVSELAGLSTDGD